MKRLLLILILTFSFQSWTKAEVDLGNLFGVKILDNVEKYAKQEDGVEQKGRPNILYFSNDVIDIKRSDDFNNYYLRTNNKFKIINITGEKYLDEDSKNFVNICLDEKKQLIKDLSIFFNADENEFKQNYWHWEKYKSIWDESKLFYEEDGNKFLLSIYCSYFKYEENIGVELGVSWVTYEYYEKYIKGLWKKIKKFDNEFIKSYIQISKNI